MRLPALGEFYESMRRQVVAATHFMEDAVTTKLITVGGDTQTPAVGTDPNGVLEITTAATDNDAAFAHTTGRINLTKGVCAHFAARASFEDANTDDANLMIAASDEVGGDQMQDDGAGIDSDMHGAGFYSIDGSDVLGVFYSDGTDQVTNLLTKAASLTNSEISATHTDADGNPKYRLFEVEIKCKTATKCDVTWKIDGTAVYQLLDQDYTDDTEVRGLVHVKAGSANAQTVKWDAGVFAGTFDDPA